MTDSLPALPSSPHGMTLRSRCDGSCGNLQYDSPNARSSDRRHHHNHHHHHHHHHRIGHSSRLPDVIRAEETSLPPGTPGPLVRLNRSKALDQGFSRDNGAQGLRLEATTAAFSHLSQRTITSVVTEETIVRSRRRKNTVSHSDYSSADEDLKVELNGSHTSSNFSQLNGSSTSSALSSRLRASSVMSDTSAMETSSGGSQHGVRFAAGSGSMHVTQVDQSARTSAFGERWTRSTPAANVLERNGWSSFSGMWSSPKEQRRNYVHLYGLDDDIDDEPIDVLETDHGVLHRKLSWMRSYLFARVMSIFWSLWHLMYWITCNAMLLDTLFIVRSREYIHNPRSKFAKFGIPLLMLLCLFAGSTLLNASNNGSTSAAFQKISDIHSLAMSNLFGLLNFSSSATENSEFSATIAADEETENGSWLNRAGFDSMLRQMVLQVYGHPPEGRVPFDTAQLDAMVQDAVRKQMAELGFTAQQIFASGEGAGDGAVQLEAEFLALKAEVESSEQLWAKYQSEMQAIGEQMNRYHQSVNLKIQQNDELVLKLEQVLQEKLLLLDHQHSLLMGAMKNCCRNHSEYAAFIKEHVVEALNSFPDAPSAESCDRLAPFQNWLAAYFTTKEDLHKHMSFISDASKGSKESDDERVLRLLRANRDMLAAAVVEEQLKHQPPAPSRAAVNLDGTVTEEQFKALINQQIALYNADRLGLPDFALESSGGSVVSTRCSESYYIKTAQYSILGIGLWYAYNSPRTVIQPGVNPGECWAFKGAQGYIVIKLSRRIRITAFSLEHIPKSISPSGSIDTAPKEFQVLGLEDENTLGVELGKYVYDQDGEPLQYFIVQDPSPPDYQMVELRVLSNHGNPDYTCLYRFRVHGDLVLN